MATQLGSSLRVPRCVAASPRPSRAADGLSGASSEVALGEIPHEPVEAGRDDRGAGHREAGLHDLPNRLELAAIDQHVPVAGTGVRLVGLVEVPRQLRVALDKVQRNDAVEHARIEKRGETRPQRVIARRARAETDDPENGAAALAPARRDAADHPAEIPEARYVLLRPVGLVRQHRLVGRAAQRLETVRRVGAEILGRGFLGDPAPCLEKALDADALGEMLAVVPEIEILLVGGVHVHRRDEHPLACQGHSERLPFVSAASARRRRRTIRASSLLWTEVKVPGAASRSGYSCRRSPSRKASGPCGSTALRLVSTVTKCNPGLGRISVSKPSSSWARMRLASKPKAEATRSKSGTAKSVPTTRPG